MPKGTNTGKRQNRESGHLHLKKMVREIQDHVKSEREAFEFFVKHDSLIGRPLPEFPTDCNSLVRIKTCELEPQTIHHVMPALMAWHPRSTIGCAASVV